MRFVYENFDVLFDTPESVETIKKLVLEMAVRGKLVPQDPNDELASVLLDKIKAEKEQLIKEKKIKKEKPLPPIEEEEKPFELPEGWEWVRLPDIVQFNNNSIRRGPYGSSITKSMFVPKDNETYKVYQQKNAIQKDCEIGEYFITERKFKELENFSVKPGDIIVSCSGTIGEAYLLPNNAQVGIINQALLKITLNNQIISNYYFLYLFQSFVRKELNRDSKGSAMKNLVSINYLKQKAFFPLPPLNEQTRIVQKIDEIFSQLPQLEKALDEKVRYNKLFNSASLHYLTTSENDTDLKDNLKLILNNFDELYSNKENVEKLRQATLSLAVRGKLVPQDPNDEPASVLLDKIKSEKEQLIKEKKIKKEKPLPPIEEDEKPFELPEGWEWVRLGQLSDSENFSIADGPFGSNLKKEDYVDNGVRIIQLQNIGEGYWKDNNKKYTSESKANELIRSNAYPGDLIVTKMAPVARTAIVPAINDRYVLCSDCVKFKPHDQINRYYIKWAINSNIVRSLAINDATGTTRQRTGLGKIKKILIPLPPLSEQTRIVQKLDKLMEQFDKLEGLVDQANESHERLLDSLIYEISNNAS